MLNYVFEGEAKATRLHLEVGREVREAITLIKGVMPENLPAESHIKTLMKDRKKKVKELADKKPI